jgi:hypothetical protein
LSDPVPPLPSEVEAYEQDVRRRLLVKPGLTGLWQVSGRSNLSWQDSVRLDLYYVENWSLAGDLIIILGPSALYFTAPAPTNTSHADNGPLGEGNFIMRISVIGCGYLGAVHAACMAKLGHEVVGIDVDERKILELSAARAPFYEPGWRSFFEKSRRQADCLSQPICRLRLVVRFTSFAWERRRRRVKTALT